MNERSVDDFRVILSAIILGTIGVSVGAFSGEIIGRLMDI